MNILAEPTHRLISHVLVTQANAAWWGSLA